MPRRSPPWRPWETTARNLGSGVGIRAGVPVDLLLIELVPEVGLTMWMPDQAVFVPEVGARFNVGKILEPGAYGHVAYLFGEKGGVGWDAGLSLDLTLIPRIDLGVQAGVQRYGPVSPALTAGLHAGIKL